MIFDPDILNQTRLIPMSHANLLLYFSYAACAASSPQFQSEYDGIFTCQQFMGGTVQSNNYCILAYWRHGTAHISHYSLLPAWLKLVIHYTSACKHSDTRLDNELATMHCMFPAWDEHHLTKYQVTNPTGTGFALVSQAALYIGRLWLRNICKFSRHWFLCTAVLLISYGLASS